MGTTQSYDQWEKAREDAKRRLQQCQKERGVESCMKCEELLRCEIRDAYVKAVYDSMNKGTGGGFEF